MSAFAMAGIVLSVLPPVLAAIHARRAVAERPQLRNLAQALPEVHRELREAISNGSHNGGLFKASKEGGARFFTAWLAIGETDPHVIDTLETIKNFRPILDRLHEVLIHILKPLPNARSLRDIVETERDDPTYSIKNGCLRFDSKAELLVAQELSMKLRIISKDLKSHNGHKPTGEFHRPGGSEKAQSSFFDSIRHYSIQLYRVLSERWKCTCHTARGVMLELEKRETTKDLRFSLIFTSTHQQCWSYQKADVLLHETYVLLKFKP
jgi:hypothetical protein